jgi:DNA-binding NarL/FixJ family response regulator
MTNSISPILLRSELGERYRAISVVVLAVQQDRRSVVKAFDLGAAIEARSASPRADPISE